MTNDSAAFPSPIANPQRDRSASELNLRDYILIVDDEQVVRDFLTRCLEREGYTVRQAASAAEALELMVERPAAIVLCDIRMPGQDGLWLIERLRAHWPATPVVMSTAIDDFQTVSRTRELGAVDYISKPIKPGQLLEVVRRVMASRPKEVPMSQEPDLEAEETAASAESKIEAEYTLETPVRCPACGERIAVLKAVRLVRAQVNFTSTLPRRGRVIACPHCLAIVPAELTNF
jgi:CheY-like chemotaxis protein/DNA-directed RNA polymerase subunit RPC12/RpoP